MFAQIDKISENVVRPEKYLQHQWIFFCNTLYMHLQQSSHESCEVSSWSNSKWPTSRHFVCSNWQNIWKFCPSGWISQTPMNIVLRYSTHALTIIFPWILWSFIMIKFKMADLLLFLFADILKWFIKDGTGPYFRCLLTQNHTMFWKKIEVLTKFASITSRKGVREPKNVILALEKITFVSFSSTNGVPCYIVEILELNVITSVLVLCINFSKDYWFFCL